MRLKIILMGIGMAAVAITLPACGGNSESEAIDREIAEIEAMNEQFERAYSRGADAEAKRISEEAWNKYQALEKKDLTPAQRERLSRMFTL